MLPWPTARCAGFRHAIPACILTGDLHDDTVSQWSGRLRAGRHPGLGRSTRRGQRRRRAPAIIRFASRALAGRARPARNVSRAVVVAPGQRNIDVEAGESVAFRFGTQKAAWAFAPCSDAGALERVRKFSGIPAALGIWMRIRPGSMFSGG
ncbi:CzcE family metal-binding protein [Cupriavidus sp. USMAHM13]|uniref:CzcE family metal-binding protein n=1 Tax=Cupriavidus sp. USMAHM13 TaxID=1389192 RepID=UPI0009F164A6